MTPAGKSREAGSAEVALLLAASGGDPSRDSVRRLMAEPIDWTRLTQLAVESHATPGLWEVVSSFQDLPREAGLLQTLAVVNGFRRHHILGLVERVVGQLRAAGIEVLLLKGAAMLAGGVARPAARTMSDIDLLVVEGSPEDAWRVCRANGWTLVDPAWTEDLYRSHHHLPPLVDPDGISIGLELHRTLLPGAAHLGLDVSAIRGRARWVTLGGVALQVPSVEDLLLHSCLHFAWSNKLQRAAWRAVATHAIGDAGFDWDRFVGIARRTRAPQACYWALRLARLMSDLPVPDEVLRRLEPGEGGAFAALLERHFARQMLDPTEEAAVSERVRRWLWFAALHERGGSEPGANPWNVGAVEVPGEGGDPTPRVARGPFRAAISTCGYLARLVARSRPMP